MEFSEFIGAFFLVLFQIFVYFSQIFRFKMTNHNLVESGNGCSVIQSKGVAIIQEIVAVLDKILKMPKVA